MYIYKYIYNNYIQGLHQRLCGKESSCNAGDAGHVGLILGLGRSPGAGHGNPFQYSCQKNLMDRGDQWATVHGVAESDMTEVTEHAQITIYVNLDWKIYFTSKNIINVSRIIKPSLSSQHPAQLKVINNIDTSSVSSIATLAIPPPEAVTFLKFTVTTPCFSLQFDYTSSYPSTTCCLVLHISSLFNKQNSTGHFLFCLRPPPPFSVIFVTFIQVYASVCTFWVFTAVHYTFVVHTAVHYSTVWTELNSSPTFCCYEQDPCTHPLSVSQCSPVFLSCICLGVQLMSFRAEYVLDYMMLKCFPK